MLKFKKGFTIPEVLLVVAVLTIITTLAYDDIIGIYNKKLEEEERLVQIDIKRALQLYYKENKKMPISMNKCDTKTKKFSDWDEQLENYSALYSADQFCEDVWGNTREYIVESKPETYYSGAYSYDVYYATVRSDGQNQVKDTVADWSGFTGAVNYYNYLPLNDDILIKVDDADYKVELYTNNLEKVERIENALERYHRAKRSNAISNDIINYDSMIFYPSDGRASDGAIASYYSDITTLTDPMSAVELVKVLGLSSENGYDSISGEKLYYISNPSADIFDVCKTIGSGSVRNSAPFYPPRIIITSDGNPPAGC